MGKTSSEVKNRWNAKAYDPISIRVPKGRREDIEAHAKGKGKSVNGLVSDLLMTDMGFTEEQWKAKSWKDGGTNPDV